MITLQGYSKDNIIPEGIAITWTEGMRSDVNVLKEQFEEACAGDDFWLQKLKNKPKYDVAYVYIIFKGFVIYRCQYAGWKEKGELIQLGNRMHDMPWNGILTTGPAIKAPFEINKPGFQGFRYATKLF